MIKKILVGALFAASLSGVSTVASAFDLFVNVAPPAPRYEVVPAPRRGYVWTPGYWDYRAQRHTWVAGNWTRERPGYRYVAPRWEQQNGRWGLQRGQWARGGGDRDHDGVPNRYDNHPNNPRRN